MPLLPGKKNIGTNIEELEHANTSKPKGKKRPKKQILAIALNESRKRKNKSILEQILLKSKGI